MTEKLRDFQKTKKLRRNDKSYQEIKVAKAQHKKALKDPSLYNQKRNAFLDVVVNMKRDPRFNLSERGIIITKI